MLSQFTQLTLLFGQFHHVWRETLDQFILIKYSLKTIFVHFMIIGWLLERKLRQKLNFFFISHQFEPCWLSKCSWNFPNLIFALFRIQCTLFLRIHNKLGPSRHHQNPRCHGELVWELQGGTATPLSFSRHFWLAFSLGENAFFGASDTNAFQLFLSYQLLYWCNIHLTAITCIKY